MELYDEPNRAARLPEPVALIGPADGAFADAQGAMLSCQVSQNAVGYQLLFGQDPYHLTYLYSDTPAPPTEQVMAFPFEHTWWTVCVYDEYGSTIHADPRLIQAKSIAAQPIENAATGQHYASIQQAINDALEDDEIVLGAGPCQYLENLDLKGKTLTLRSADPNDPNITAATIIVGDRRAATVTLSPGTGGASVLDGLTIIAGTAGLSCRGMSPTIVRCVIDGSGGSAIEFWEGYEPVIIDCDILGDSALLNDPRIVACWKLDETEGTIAHDSAGEHHDATVEDNPIWLPDGGMVQGALQLDGISDCVSTPFVLNPADGPFSVLVWIKGGGPGQVIISQADGADWLLADPETGALMTDLKKLETRVPKALESQAIITDGDWHRVGLVWDGTNRILYVDDITVAADTQTHLPECAGGLYIGCGHDPTAGSFWSGLIDDVRVYNRAVTP